MGADKLNMGGLRYPLDSAVADDWGVREMIGFVRSALRRDEGFSILEIMIASVILFIVLTGVLGLVGTTTNMGLDAKQRNVMVNALNAYVERVQSLPFDSVALAADGGALASEESTQVGEFTVTISPSVADGANEALKQLTVAISVSATGRTPVTMTTTVPVRDRSQFLTQANQDPATDPTVAFLDAYTPPEGTVVWGTSCIGGTGVLKLAVEATASEGRVLTNVALWIDDSRLAKNALGESGSWNPATQTFSETSFVWDTRQTEDIIQEDGSYLPVEIVADGMRTISAYTLDDRSVSVYSVRHFLVDNHAPGVPGVPAASNLTNVNATLTWAPASDGTSPADHYGVRVFKQPIDDSGPMNPYEHWPEVTVGTPTGTSLAITNATAFSRYYPVVRALSPRNLASAYTAGTPIFVTRPKITGNYTITEDKNNEYTVTSTLSCTVPTFPTSGLTYTWYRSAAGAPAVQVGTGASLTGDDCPLTVKNNDPWPEVRYYCKVTYTPLGVNGGTSEMKTSNTVATTHTGVVATSPYAEGTW
ncbi:MAG: hypothetical protein LLG08_00135 [Actinomycetia bacterium]|nr:hypothetical protein [Actinomycetes bacterium]